MVANVQPGTCGVAAMLPKKPDTQKLMPPSSARAACENMVMVAVRRTAEHCCVSSLRPVRHACRDSFLAVVVCMISPRIAHLSDAISTAAVYAERNAPLCRFGQKIDGTDQTLQDCDRKAPPSGIRSLFH